MNETPSEVWPYSERNGVGVERDFNVLLAEPEIQLSAEDLAEAYSFAHGLLEGKISESLTCESPRTLEAVNRAATAANTQTFCLGYFETPEGKNDLAAMKIDATKVFTTDELKTLLFDTELVVGTLDATARKTAASNSESWNEAVLANSLIDDPKLDADKQKPESITVNYDPDKLLQKLEDIAYYRKFYRLVRTALKQEPEDDLLQAKRVLLDVHVARVNNMMADAYAPAVRLAMQIDKSEPSEQVETWSDRLARAVPLLSRARTEDAERFSLFADRLAKRLDLVRNGAVLTEDGDMSPISSELLSLEVSEQILEADPKVSKEQIAVMDETKWTGEQLKALNESVLSEWGLLSEYQSTWQEVAEREGPAPDGKWQYVIDKPSRKSLGVVGSKKVVYGPEKFGRTLTASSPSGALPVTAHELTHVLQNEYDDVLAEKIPMARIKGARYVAVREMGGIAQERIMQANFGRTQSTNLHYLRALQTKLTGGNEVQTARAFYESYTAGKQLSDEKAAAAREFATNRALRLFRHNGYESQPLEYAEQDLIAKGLSELSPIQRTAIAIAGGTFSLNHAAALHRVGLLDLPTEVSDNPADDVWKIFQRDYLPGLQV